MTSYFEWIWPKLEEKTTTENSEDALSNRHDIDAIQRANWSKDVDTALDEARRLSERERARSANAEAKATTYLTLVAALIPLLTYLHEPFLRNGTYSLFNILLEALLFLGTLYLVRGGIWAFRTLKVGEFHQIDCKEILGFWSEASPKQALAQATFQTTRQNRDSTNIKISYIKMAHEFILRAFLVFGLLLAAEIGVQLWKLCK